MCHCDKQLAKLDDPFDSPFTDPGVVTSPPILPDIIAHTPMPMRDPSLRDPRVNPITRARLVTVVSAVPGSPSDDLDDRSFIDLKGSLLPVLGIAAIAVFFLFGKGAMK